jgi:hypothetical protein
VAVGGPGVGGWHVAVAGDGGGAYRQPRPARSTYRPGRGNRCGALDAPVAGGRLRRPSSRRRRGLALAGGDGMLEVVSLADGTLRWARRTGLAGPLAGVGGLVLAAAVSGSPRLASYDGRIGRVRWMSRGLLLDPALAVLTGRVVATWLFPSPRRVHHPGRDRRSHRPAALAVRHGADRQRRRGPARRTGCPRQISRPRHRLTSGAAMADQPARRAPAMGHPHAAGTAQGAAADHPRPHAHRRGVCRR